MTQRVEIWHFLRCREGPERAQFYRCCGVYEWLWLWRILYPNNLEGLQTKKDKGGGTKTKRKNRGHLLPPGNDKVGLFGLTGVVEHRYA